jgi:hypothetical protein
MTVKQIEKALLKLDFQSRAQLAGKLLKSLETPSEQENERLWAEESLRRYEEVKSGRVKGKSSSRVMKGARAQLK